MGVAIVKYTGTPNGQVQSINDRTDIVSIENRACNGQSSRKIEGNQNFYQTGKAQGKINQTGAHKPIQTASSTRRIQSCMSSRQGTKGSRDRAENVKNILQRVPGMKTSTWVTRVRLLCTHSSNYRGKHTIAAKDIHKNGLGYRVGYPYTYRTCAINQQQDGHSVHRNREGNGEGSRKIEGKKVLAQDAHTVQ